METQVRNEAEPAVTHPSRQERFDTIRGRVGLVLGPLVFAVVLLAAGGLPWSQRALAAVLVLVVVWWVTEAVPLAVTAVFAIVLCVFLGVADEDTVFGAFGNDTIFTFLGGFVIARAMTVHGLDRRIALRVLSIGAVVKSPARTVIAFGAMAVVISAFISNTATVAMLFPIGIGIVGAVNAINVEKGGRDLKFSRWSTALMLMIAYGASIGGLLTPIGAPHQLIGRDLVEEQTGRTINFVEWVLTFAPIVLVMFVVLCVVLLWLNRPEVGRLDGAAEYVAAQRAQLGGFSRGEANTCVAFALAVVLWTAPGVGSLILGDDNGFVDLMHEHLTEGVAAIFAATALFLLPLRRSAGRREATLSWSEAVKIDWGVILLFGAGTVIGSLSSETGLAKTLGSALAEHLGVSSLTAITILAAVTGLIISETTSNTASAGIVVPIVVPIAVAVGVNPLVPGLVATAAAGYGFMLPVSTPPNAIVYGSGMVPMTRMIRSGAVFDVLGVAVLVTGVLLMSNLVGF
ncbi:DASS family sodium-coupled anion symporter [Amycolatopsis endophytica]|uniref:Sodium-dependent dicarboxylate transporter SdcS n=1 Tax=Amycolatopsis endophytica TaxID=860233 RepID=A0A853B652_9PSEU|nr:DASS family sodium-coupled anion symporter [Amycolatopsis endophytica]NYI90470.1 sodium-dependent dicarboxylate transporter 2/3/5 [Amycolatopsis endophytica]